MAEDKKSPFVRIDTREILVNDIDNSEESNPNIPVIHQTGEWGAGLGLGSEVSTAKIEVRDRLRGILQEIDELYNQPKLTEAQQIIIRMLIDSIEQNFPNVKDREAFTIELFKSGVLALGDEE